jgi:hypothetical protein
MKSVCTEFYIELNNKNRILEHLVRNLGNMIDGNENKLDEIELKEDFDSLYEALNSLKEQYLKLEEDLCQKIQDYNNNDNFAKIEMPNI